MADSWRPCYVQRMLLAAAALFLATSSPIALDELVRKAGENEVASDAAFKDRPCTLTIDAKELDKKGGVKDASEIVLRREVVDGKPHDELVRYVENGKDVTEEKKKAKSKKDAEEPKAKKGEDGDEDEDEDDDDDGELRSPFHPKVVESYAFEDLGADASDSALRRIRFQPKPGAAGEDLLTGEAILTADARLHSVRARPAKLPMLVSAMDIAAAFGASGEIERMEMSGEAGALFIKKRFRVVTTFAWSPR